MDITNAIISTAGIIISVSNLLLVFYLTRRSVVDKSTVDILQPRNYTPSKTATGKLRPRAKSDDELYFDEIEENKRKPRF